MACCVYAFACRYLLAKYSYELGQYAEAETALLKETVLEVRRWCRASALVPGSTPFPWRVCIGDSGLSVYVHVAGAVVQLLAVPNTQALR